jgi:type II secretory ATPase GspE/PulE/Tfp pilus assembly ATPase PilB-like protein
MNQNISSEKSKLSVLTAILKPLVFHVSSTENIDAILFAISDELKTLFQSEAVTIFSLDKNGKKLYSRNFRSHNIGEIIVDCSKKSLAGYVALTREPLVIKDVYDKKELSRYSLDLNADHSWDEKLDFITKSALVLPILNADNVVGVLEILNKEGNQTYTNDDMDLATEMGSILGAALAGKKNINRTKYSYLIDQGLLSEEDSKSIMLRARSEHKEIEDILLNEIQLTREDIGASLENFYKIPYEGLTEGVLSNDLFSGLNKNYLKKQVWVPVKRELDQVVILIDDPTNLHKKETIKKLFPKKKIEFRVSLKSDIYDLLAGSSAKDNIESIKSEPEIEGMSSLLIELEEENQDPLGLPNIEEDTSISEEDSVIVRLVNRILIDAFEKGASDIHFEPGVEKNNINVRFRKDGICKIYQEIPYQYKHAILSRIKIMAKLDIAEKRLPQDGKILMNYKNKKIEFRVATCPTVGSNEDAVIRILAASKPLPLEKMNFLKKDLALIQKQIKKPYGLILAVGPTGSGKTTTLHSSLGYINTPDKKIWTAEDPVEITQKGLRQVQMLQKIGLDFKTAMRSFLRGDPDVIMVGEMRDSETCAIGLEASLTGHIVFSTLHTNSAPETIVRLIDLGMNPLNFADALLLIIAQRLVRTLCKECKKSYHPTQKEFDVLVHEYGEEEFSKIKVKYKPDLTLYKAKGCKKCEKTGYAGRTGIYELLEGTLAMKDIIIKGAKADEIRTQAISDGMTTLKQDGIHKVLNGDCDLQQVNAVCIL